MAMHPPEKKRVKLSLRDRKEKLNSTDCETNPAIPIKVVEKSVLVNSCEVLPIHGNISEASISCLSENLKYRLSENEPGYRDKNLSIVDGGYKNISWENWKQFPCINFSPDTAKEPKNETLSVSNLNTKTLVHISEGISFEWTPLPRLCRKCFCRRSTSILTELTSASKVKTKTDTTLTDIATMSNIIKTSAAQSKFTSIASSHVTTVTVSSSNSSSTFIPAKINVTTATTEIVNSNLIRPLFGKPLQPFAANWIENYPLSETVSTTKVATDVRNNSLNAPCGRNLKSFLTVPIASAVLSAVPGGSKRQQITNVDVLDSLRNRSTSDDSKFDMSRSDNLAAGILDNSTIGQSTFVRRSNASTSYTSVRSSSSVNNDNIESTIRTSSYVEMVQKCPLCSILFDHRINQVDRDAHIAACLQSTNYDDDEIAW